MAYITNRDEIGCYASKSPNSERFYFDLNDPHSRIEAIKKAIIQSIGDKREEGKIKREQKNIKIKAQQKKRADEVRKELKRLKDKEPKPVKPDKPNKHNNK